MFERLGIRHPNFRLELSSIESLCCVGNDTHNAGQAQGDETKHPMRLVLVLIAAQTWQMHLREGFSFKPTSTKVILRGKIWEKWFAKKR
jgi:hypothetical protein